MKRWRLSPRAEQSLFDIVVWTKQNFGKNQARKYQAQLIGKIDAIATRSILPANSCSRLVPNNNQATSLRYTLIGRHYIIYRETADELQIVEFVHGARDLPSLLENLK